MNNSIHKNPEILFYTGDEEWQADYSENTVTLSNNVNEIIVIDLTHRTISKSSKIEPLLTFEELLMVQDVLFEGEIE